MIGGGNLRQLVRLLSPEVEHVTISLAVEHKLSLVDFVFLKSENGVYVIHVIVSNGVGKGKLVDPRRTRDMVAILGCLSMVVVQMFRPLIRALIGMRSASMRDLASTQSIGFSRPQDWHVVASSTCGFSVCTETDEEMPEAFAHIMRNIVHMDALDVLTDGLTELNCFWGDQVDWRIDGPQYMLVDNTTLECVGLQPFKFGKPEELEGTVVSQVFDRSHVTMTKAAVSELTHFIRPHLCEVTGRKRLGLAYLVDAKEISFQVSWIDDDFRPMFVGGQAPESYLNTPEVLRSVLYADGMYSEYHGFSLFSSLDLDQYYDPANDDFRYFRFDYD